MHDITYCVNQMDRVVAVSMDSEALVRKGTGRRHCNECDKGFNVAHIDEVCTACFGKIALDSAVKAQHSPV